MSYLLSFYGDDFTGSTDVMEALTLGGVPAVLFLAPPTREQLNAFPEARAIGIAGTSRSMTPAQMDAHLPQMFSALKRLDAQFCHYKVCSTFDSSPTLGNIGRAAELALETFPQPLTPLIVGAPVLKRYVLFGNVFATMDGVTYRLDRHPTMSKHPATPMVESDLRVHLSEQTTLSIANLDVLLLEQGIEACLERAKTSGADLVLFDTLTDAHLEILGEVLVFLQAEGVRFLVGSSGTEYALIAYLLKQGEVRALTTHPTVPRVEQLIVVSGSAAPPTAAQISEAGRRGFTLIRINVPQLIDPDAQEAEKTRLLEVAFKALENGKSPLLYSAYGPDDPAIAETRAAMKTLGYAPSDVGVLLGTQQGKLLRDLLEATGIRRACVAGGDTCGYAAQQLGIYALELLKPIAPGSPLCRAHSEHEHLNGLELSLKSGQVGQADYFITVRDGL